MKTNGYCNYNNIFSYYYNSIRTTGLFNTVLKISKFTRSYFFISRLIKYTAVVVAFIETSASLIVATAILLVLIPVILASTAITYFASLIEFRKTNPIMKEVIEKSEKLVFIDAKKGYFRKKNHYVNNMAKQFRDEGNTVIVVSHPIIHDRFISAIKAEDGIWVVKMNYYFTLKRKILDECEKPMTYIY